MVVVEGLEGGRLLTCYIFYPLVIFMIRSKSVLHAGWKEVNIKDCAD